MNFVLPWNLGFWNMLRPNSFAVRYVPETQHARMRVRHCSLLTFFGCLCCYFLCLVVPHIHLRRVWR
jgi:hypothetical protein